MSGEQGTGSGDGTVREVAAALGPLFDVRSDHGTILTASYRRSAPWWLRIEPSPGGLFAFFTCRTTSADFGGDRTDIHDVLSLLLAVHLLQDGRSSALLDVEHPVFPDAPEIYARHVIPFQPTSHFTTASGDDSLHNLGGPIIVLSHLLPKALGIYKCLDEGTFGSTGQSLEAWADDVRAGLGVRPHGRDVITWRRNPDLMYFRSTRTRAAVVQSEAVAIFIDLLLGHTDIEQRRLKTRGAELLVMGRSSNAVPAGTLRRVASVLRRVEQCPPRHVIALENAVVGVGCRHVVALPADSGRHRFDTERRLLVDRHEAESEFVHLHRTFTWAPSIHPGRFEELVRELLAIEPGTAWVRLAGSVNDRDQGRDLLIQRTSPQLSSGGELDRSPVVTQRIVGQCKVRRGGVSKGDVPDITDTIVRHGADGYFLAVATHTTSDLTSFLEDRRNAGGGWYDWWTRIDIEERLRRHPGVLERFPDLVTADDAVGPRPSSE
jgi:hypothetical protein